MQAVAAALHPRRINPQVLVPAFKRLWTEIGATEGAGRFDDRRRGQFHRGGAWPALCCPPVSRSAGCGEDGREQDDQLQQLAVLVNKRGKKDEGQGRRVGSDDEEEGFIDEGFLPTTDRYCQTLSNTCPDTAVCVGTSLLAGRCCTTLNTC